MYKNQNYCSPVWGFAAKSHIDSLFRKQQSGIRAVMDGFVEFRYYRDGVIPTRARSTFNSKGNEGIDTS